MLNTVKKSQDLYINRLLLKFLVRVTLGTMVLAVCFLFLGCGSDSKSGKSETADARTKSEGAAPLRPMKVAPGESGKIGQVKKDPESPRMESFGGLSPQELEAKAAESMAKLHKQKSSGPVIGGMTYDELVAKAEESRKKLKTKGGGEIFPGITQEELERMAAKNQKGQPRSVQEERFPGATKTQLDASSRSPKPNFQEMFPSAAEK
jgi:hypothetical protein